MNTQSYASDLPANHSNTIERDRGSVDRYQVLLLCLVFSAEVIVYWIGWLPLDLSLDNFGFGDQGANLTVQFLVSHGLRPAIDFGYAYGLLPLFVGKLWFGLFGTTPFAYQTLILLCDILMAAGIAAVVTRLRIGAIGIALLVIALGLIIQASYPSLAEATEQVLLTLALAEQAHGKPRTALAFATAATFAKPSMAYFYGLILTVLIAVDLLRSKMPLRGWIRAFIPAAVTGLTLALVLGYQYGPSSLLKTLFPIEGFRNYQALGFGFFGGSGRGFWDIGNIPWLAYFLEMTAFWTAATLFLISVAPFAAARWIRDLGRDELSLQFRQSELIVTCAVLHVLFITVLFGNQWSWFYYAYLLVLGSAIAVGLSPIGRRAGIVLCALGLVVWAYRTWSVNRHWTTDRRYAATGQVWTSPAEMAEWNKALNLVHDKSTVVLDINGAVELMVPGFAPPTSLYLLPGLMRPSEVNRKLNQLDKATLVLVPIGIHSPCKGVPNNPLLRSALNAFEPEWKGEYFEVFRRKTSLVRASHDAD